MQPRARQPLGSDARVASAVRDGAEPDADPAPAPVGLAQAGGGHADHGEVAVTPRVLHDDRLGARAVREVHRLQHLGRFERRRVRPLEERLRVELTATRGPDDAQTRAQRHCAEGHLAGRIGMTQRAAERAAIADLPVADEGDGFREQRDPLADHRGCLQCGVARQRPDAHHTVTRDDAIEPRDPVDIDNCRRPQESHAQERHEALPAGKQPRVAGEALEGGERLLRRRCREVLERGRLHQRWAFLSVPHHNRSIRDIAAAPLPGSPINANQAPNTPSFRDRLIADLRGRRRLDRTGHGRPSSSGTRASDARRGPHLRLPSTSRSKDGGE